MKPRHLFCLIVICFILFSSCASQPPSKPAQSWLGLLPENSSLYISVTDTIRVRELITALLPLMKLNLPDVHSILKDTEQIYAALAFNSKDEESAPLRFSLVLAGRYSSCGIGFGLSASNQWVKDKKTGRYWQQAKSELKIAQPEGYLLLITNDNMEEFFSRRKNPRPVKLSPAAERFVEQNPAALFFPRFGDEVIPENIPVNKISLPIGEVIIGINQGEKGYAVTSSFDLADDANARIFSVTLRIFIIWMMRNAGIDSFTSRVDVKTDDHYVQCRLSDFTASELVQVITAILDAGK